jgi:hypothetical protein
MTATNIKPINGNGLDAANDQPAKLITKRVHILGAIRAFIHSSLRGFTIDRGFGLDSIVPLILEAALLIQGVMQWMQ